MSKRGNIKTSRKQIIEYWETCQDECELSVDWAEAEERCWRCGCETNRKLDRCHIIPHALGGKDVMQKVQMSLIQRLCGIG